MKLTAQQIETFDRDGFLVFPDLLSADEVALLKSELARVSAVPDERIIREKGSDAPRIIYGLPDVDGPTGSRAYYELARNERILQPVIDLLQEDVYLYHIKCNFKEAIDGGIWQWHQDFAYWNVEDAAPEPQMLTTMVMLDRATEMNGCLCFVPGSHKLGIVKSDWNDAGTSFAIWTVDKQNMLEITAKLGDPVPIVGGPGTVALFHANLIHGSGHNMSPHSRWQAYLVYNAVSNKLGQVAKPRPDYQANRKVEPLVVSKLRSFTDVAELAPV
ncbi:MAG: phytanoyl-CoA dioxygenase family protein [Alphaproteobacteria bacterium]